MAETLSLEVEQLLQEQIDGKHFVSANEVLLFALRLLKEIQDRYHCQLSERIKHGFDQIARGEGIELADEAELRAFFDSKKQNGGVNRPCFYRRSDDSASSRAVN